MHKWNEPLLPSPRLQSIIALWPAPISRPTQGRRLSWPVKNVCVCVCDTGTLEPLVVLMPGRYWRPLRTAHSSSAEVTIRRLKPNSSSALSQLLQQSAFFTFVYGAITTSEYCFASAAVAVHSSHMIAVSSTSWSRFKFC